MRGPPPRRATSRLWGSPTWGWLGPSAASDAGRDLAPDLVHGVEVAGEQVLEHDALDARLRQLAQPRRQLVERAGEPGIRQLSEEVLGFAALPAPLGQPAGAVEQLGAVLARQPAGHERQRDRVPPFSAARLVEVAPHLGALGGGLVDRVVLVAPARREPEAARPAAAAHDERRARALHRLRMGVEVLDRVVPALERERPPRPP